MQSSNENAESDATLTANDHRRLWEHSYGHAERVKIQVTWDYVTNTAEKKVKVNN